MTAADPADLGTPWGPGVATGIGSLPGTDPNEAARSIAGELPELPHVPELPERGVGADTIGRAVGMLVDLHAEVVPSGWRLTRRPARETRRAVDFLAWDADAVQQHYGGAAWIKTQVCGPWTLAAALEVPSGHRALTDAGAVDDLAASLAEGLVAHVDELARRVPDARIVVQIDEPSLPAVLTGSLRTASGFGTIGAVPASRAGQLLSELLGALGDRPAVVHCCGADPPLSLFRAAGFGAISTDLTLVGAAAARLDRIGEAVESGVTLLAGLVPSVAPGSRPELRALADPMLTIWDQLGFPRSRLASAVVPTPTCGLAGATGEWSVRAMRWARELARAFEDPPDGW